MITCWGPRTAIQSIFPLQQSCSCVWTMGLIRNAITQPQRVCVEEQVLGRYWGFILYR